jgi:hypothetical protein
MGKGVEISLFQGHCLFFLISLWRILFFIFLIYQLLPMLRKLTLFTLGGEVAGISLFLRTCNFFSEFSMAKSIFYFSNISADVTVVITHRYSPQGVKEQEFQNFKKIAVFL